jgi:hypothetical protein
MEEIGVFGRLLFLVGHMDQEIKSVTLSVTPNDRQELLSV